MKGTAVPPRRAGTSAATAGQSALLRLQQCSTPSMPANCKPSTSALLTPHSAAAAFAACRWGGPRRTKPPSTTWVGACASSHSSSAWPAVGFVACYLPFNRSLSAPQVNPAFTHLIPGRLRRPAPSPSADGRRQGAARASHCHCGSADGSAQSPALALADVMCLQYRFVAVRCCRPQYCA